jgi:hypothetical protein
VKTRGVAYGAQVSKGLATLGAGDGFKRLFVRHRSGLLEGEVFAVQREVFPAECEGVRRDEVEPAALGESDGT